MGAGSASRFEFAVDALEGFTVSAPFVVSTEGVVFVPVMSGPASAVKGVGDGVAAVTTIGIADVEVSVVALDVAAAETADLECMYARIAHAPPPMTSTVIPAAIAGKSGFLWGC